jgi:hypothetical protein
MVTLHAHPGIISIPAAFAPTAVGKRFPVAALGPHGTSQDLNTQADPRESLSRRKRLAITKLGEALARGLDLLISEQARELGLQDESLDSEIETASLVKRGEPAGDLG